MKQTPCAGFRKILLPLFCAFLTLSSCRSIVLSQSVSINFAPPPGSRPDLFMEARLLGESIAEPFESVVRLCSVCADFAPSPTSVTVEDLQRMPVLLQTEPYSCGPVALAEVFSYWGRSLNPDLLSQHLKAEERKGVSVIEMAAYPRRLGFWVESHFARSPEDLKRWLGQGFPVILLIDSGAGFVSVGHYIVLAGYDERENHFLALTGRGKRAIDQTSLDYVWRKKGRWFGVIVPPERVTWAASPGKILDLGVCFELSGNPEQAIRCYEKVLTVETNSAILSKAHNNLGNICAAREDWESAEEHYAQALALQPRNAQALNSLAYTYAVQRKNLKEAERLVKKALEIDSKHSGIFLDTLGLVLLAQDRTDEAIEAFQKAISQIPPGEKKILSSTYLHLGEALLAKPGRKSDALSALSEAARLCPECEDVRKAIELADPPTSAQEKK